MTLPSAEAIAKGDHPLASVVICTRNRARSLARTLDSLIVAAGQTDEPWELIVVDNGSSDDTAATINGFAARLPLRLVSQPIPGVSNARNAGVAVVRGDYVLWTDDDVVVDPQWLAAWFRAFRANPDDAVFGGRSEPHFEEPKQEWFVAAQEHLQSLLAVRDANWKEVNGAQMPFGLNFAVRAAEQRQFAYDPKLGVAPGRRSGGEEMAMVAGILARGGTGSWNWDAVVYHMITAERQTVSYILHYYEANGFEYPIFHPRFSFYDRTKGILKAIPVLIGCGGIIAVGFITRQINVGALVKWGLVRGTIRNYLKSRG